MSGNVRWVQSSCFRRPTPICLHPLATYPQPWPKNVNLRAPGSAQNMTRLNLVCDESGQRKDGSSLNIWCTKPQPRNQISGCVWRFYWKQLHVCGPHLFTQEMASVCLSVTVDLYALFMYVFIYLYIYMYPQWPWMFVCSTKNKINICLP